MRRDTVVASANVLCDLDLGPAERALELVLDRRPDLVGLQEWGLRRRRSLTRTAPGYIWCPAPYGGCVAGARADRYELRGWRLRMLGSFARCETSARSFPLLPPRCANVSRWHDRLLGTDLSLVVYHLVPGTQSRGRYRDDRPLLVSRHRAEVARLEAIVGAELARTDQVYAVGDSNFDGLRLTGLTSAWEGREREPRGTLSSTRKIDDVFGPGRAGSVDLVANPSDHQAVVTRRP